ncbi:MAG: hypothetical protein CMF22_13380 [Idiomarinaceae bacterium]|nr:hypothetical protein [Idiomarinaceae bacterium]HCV05710.1 hypothetical protein [Pseudoalteromonas sp.]|tara:strand:+ start:17165 stop:18232 length:1068 start_codon:yes stop_codon:yes gene_type:complete
MLPYLLLLFFTSGLTLVIKKYGSDDLYRGTVFFVAAALISFAGLRDFSVGTDSGTYVRQFERFILEPEIFKTSEFGYNLLMFLASILSDQYFVLFTIIALLVVSFYFLAISKLTQNFPLAVFIFVSYGTYTFFFNGARQGIAAAICFYALTCLLTQRIKNYFLLVLLASLFHHTALIMLPIYFMVARKVNLLFLIYIFAAGGLISLLLTPFIESAAPLINDRYIVYSKQMEAAGGGVTALFLLFQGLVFYSLRKWIQKNVELYNVLLSIYLMGLVPVIITVLSNLNPSGIFRMHVYFTPVSAILWPLVIESIRNKNERLVLYLFFVLFSMLYFTLSLTSFSHLTPYRLNNEVSPI